jgi:hypothetical protein
MAPSSKDIKELMAARKARRAIPQTDPAEVVTGPPEPELAGPPQPVQPDAAPASVTPVRDPRSGDSGSAETPALVLEPDDPRTNPVPPDDLYETTTLRIKKHQRRQLKAEAYHRGLLMQDVIETALGEYFKKRYGRQGRGQ